MTLAICLLIAFLCGALTTSKWVFDEDLDWLVGLFLGLVAIAAWHSTTIWGALGMIPAVIFGAIVRGFILEIRSKPRKEDS